MQLAFGPGSVWGVPLGATPTPVRLALAKSSGLNFSSQIKGAYGANVFAKALGRGTTTVKGTLECEALSLATISDLFLNGVVTTGGILVADDEAGTVPASSTYVVTVSNAATFVKNLGVKYTATGLRLTRVASVSAVGQYSVDESTGVYTFYSGDASAAVKISYRYTAVAGSKATLNNYLQGNPNSFQAVMMRRFQANMEVITLNSVLADGYDDTAGQDAFTNPKLTFQAATDDSDVLGTIAMAEYQ